MSDTQPAKNDDPGFKMDGYGSENPALDHAFRIVDEALPPKARGRGHMVVCHKDEIPVGGKRIVEDGGLSIGVFNISGEFWAVKNVCPHAGAPLCMGSVHATHRPGDVFEFRPDLHGRVLRCPWHGWEFDILTGKALYDRNSRIATYPVEVSEDGNVVVLL
jgi:nitrite reductase/ring-hydroxylating ferredoxin subunit